MEKFYSEQLADVYCGDALQVLKSLPDESVQMAITSPPYWGLRNYAGGFDIVWGEDGCQHEWGNILFGGRNKRAQDDDPKFAKGLSNPHGNASICSLCGCWRGQLGLEPTPELYVEHLMMIFREVKRVLKREGSFWLNLGDTYSASWGNMSHEPARDYPVGRPPQSYKLSVPPKCMVCIPERVMFAMIGDGWILRNKCIWHKSNAMPSSVKDRFTTTYEMLYFFVKAKKYYFDLDAVRVPHKTQSLERYQRQVNFDATGKMPANKYIGEEVYPGSSQIHRGGRNLAPDWFGEMFPPDEDYKGKFAQMAESGANTGEHKKEPYQNNNPHQITPAEAPNRSSKDWKAEAAKRGQLFDNPVAHQGGGNTGLRMRTPSQIALEHGYDPEGICPVCGRSWKRHASNSKDRQAGIRREFIPCTTEARGRPLIAPHPPYRGDGWGRQAIEGRRKGRRSNNPELNNRNFMLIKHDIAVGRTGNVSYTDPLHTKDYSPKGKNPGDVINTERSPRKYSGETMKETKHGFGLNEKGHSGYFYKDGTPAVNPLGKNPGDTLTARQENIISHFEQKGSGGHYLYGGIESPEGRHEFPLGKNPGDTLEATTVRHKSWMSTPGHPYTHKATGKPQNPGDYWEITTQPFKGAHFAVFPEALCERPILASSRVGDIVLDPLAGSGTTGVVAKKLGRKAILIDVVPEYCEIAKQRIQKVEYQPELGIK